MGGRGGVQRSRQEEDRVGGWTGWTAGGRRECSTANLRQSSLNFVAPVEFIISKDICLKMASKEKVSFNLAVTCQHCSKYNVLIQNLFFILSKDTDINLTLCTIKPTAVIGTSCWCCLINVL